MASKERVAFNVWQNLFYQLIPNYEEIVDPTNPYHQIAVHTAIHELAKVITDRPVREAIQGMNNKSIANIAAKAK